MPEIPDSIDDVDTAWLSTALGLPVSGFDVEFLEGGVLADAYRIGPIRYDRSPTDPPRSLIVKIPSQHTQRREMAIANGAYLKEVAFFRDLAADMPLRSPTLHHLATDGSPDAARFVLVMEDLGAHSRVFDQVEDNPDEAFMRKIALEVAAMHARYWDAPETRLPWLASGDGRYRFTFDAACRESPDRLDEFAALWRRHFGREVWEEGGAIGSEAITRLLCGPRSASILDRIEDRLSSRPRTLLHGDLRADNIFRTDPARRLDVESSQLTYIDWQLLGAGPPGIEFAQMWIHSLPEALRRKDTEVLRSYHDRLVSLNPAASDYTADMLIEDYVLGLCLWWSALVTIGANTLAGFDDPASARMKRLWELGIPRTLIALDDHDGLARIEAMAG